MSIRLEARNRGNVRLDMDNASLAAKYAREAEAAGYHACKVCEGKEGVATANKQPRMLKGNPNTKMLHGPSCKYYDAKGTTEKFSNMDQAVKQGYKLCSICEGK